MEKYMDKLLKKTYSPPINVLTFYFFEAHNCEGFHLLNFVVTSFTIRVMPDAFLHRYSSKYCCNKRNAFNTMCLILTIFSNLLNQNN